HLRADRGAPRHLRRTAHRNAAVPVRCSEGSARREGSTGGRLRRRAQSLRNDVHRERYHTPGRPLDRPGPSRSQFGRARPVLLERRIPMADEIEVQIPNLRYDITLPLVEGRVPVEGVKLVASRSAPGGTVMNADSPLATGDFGLVDLNMGNLLPAIEAGWELTALPVFSKRKPVYTFVFCRAESGIT